MSHSSELLGTELRAVRALLDLVETRFDAVVNEMAKTVVGVTRPRCGEVVICATNAPCGYEGCPHVPEPEPRCETIFDCDGRACGQCEEVHREAAKPVKVRRLRGKPEPVTEDRVEAGAKLAHSHHYRSIVHGWDDLQAHDKSMWIGISRALAEFYGANR